ncbi:carbamoyltransferase HypF [Amphritea balenae]|uniref:Carbamoyltransferase HypF n=1 Tax=Amphritea balenae TaxID=452629 RepID=A0A3P1SVY6_9GAMM|nr:carbamoyltransferase HypF [Amphritea balenae]
MNCSAVRVRISGQVQGVGFRPFVYNLACRLGLRGEVANSPAGVELVIEGDESGLTRFQQLLWDELPPMALIEQLNSEPVPLSYFDSFKILPSAKGEVSITATPDAAVCPDCLAELFNPSDRRYLYPFINCTNCGPRYSLIKALPYDRTNTTMSAFDLCTACLSEYNDPADRRFHAQPNACPDCGPGLSFTDEKGHFVKTGELHDESLIAAATLIRAGKIVAVKGVGGFHLICDARNADAVVRLRQQKQRPDKPFALLGLNTESLNTVVQLDDNRRQRLQAQDAPVLLCPWQKETSLDTENRDLIASGLNWCGVMLPHSPLHFLLLHQLCGRPEASDWLESEQQPLLVMTSANRSGNPLITDNQQALIELRGIADGFLLHNRDIHIRCDDSVVNGLSDSMPIVRRGRGLAPQVIQLPQSGPSVLATGAFFKNTICVTKGDKAYVSQYIGDLDNPDCCHSLSEMVNHLIQLLDVVPQQVVCDQHPDFFSSLFARQFAERHDLPLQSVQHHHAHIAAVMAEHQLSGAVLGLALDGLGLGDCDQLWGGELLRVDGRGTERTGRLSSLLLPGGDKAAAEPWRVAAGMLYQSGQSDEIDKRFHYAGVATVKQMLNQHINCPQTSSAGRLFDGVAALLGLCSINSYEAQAAMQLESAALSYVEQYGWPECEPLLSAGVATDVAADSSTIDSADMTLTELNLATLLTTLSEIEDPLYGAALFHRQFIDGLGCWVFDTVQASGINRVVLAGGCFLNQLLLRGLTEQLELNGIEVFSAGKIPCNDGGISLGQAQVALQLSLPANRQNSNY